MLLLPHPNKFLSLLLMLDTSRLVMIPNILTSLKDCGTKLTICLHKCLSDVSAGGGTQAHPKHQTSDSCCLRSMPGARQSDNCSLLSKMYILVKNREGLHGVME
jgi:hypothetical protein